MIAIKLLFSILALGFILAPAGRAAEQFPIPTEQELVEVLGCKGCHTIAGGGGSTAPKLDQVGSRLTEKQIAEHLTAGVSSKNKFMPSYHLLPESTISRMGAYLYNLK